MLGLFGKLPWQFAPVVGLGLIGYAVYRLVGHHHGVGPVVTAVVGGWIVVRGLMRSRGHGVRR